MASVHEMNYNDDPDSSPSCTVGSSCNLNDCSSPPEENLLSSFSSSIGSQPLFHQYHGNEPTASQGLCSSSHQPLIFGMNVIQPYLQQPGGISNIPESSHLLYRQSYENVSSMVQETPLFFKQQSENRLSDNKDAVPLIPSGTEFGESQNVQQLSENDGSHPSTIQSSDSVPCAKQQLLSERHNFSENICNKIQEMHSQTKLDVNEFSGTQNSYQPAQQFAESDMKRNKGFDSLIQQQSGNEPIASQSSHPLSLKPLPSISNILQTAYSASRDVLGNKFSANQARNIPSYFHYSGESSKIQDLSLKSLQHSMCRSEDIQSSNPQELQQSEREPNTIRNKYSSSHLASGINFIQDYGLHSPTRAIPNKLIMNQDLHLLTQQPVESETRETKGLDPLPQALKDNNPKKRQLPHSHSQQQFKRGLCAISHAESQPSTSDTSYLLPDNSPGMGSSINEKQTISSEQATNKAINIEPFDLSMLQHPYSNRCELINILVYGPADWTSRLLQTYAGGTPLRFVSPYSFAFQRNITRCGILMTVSLWKIDDLIKSVRFLKSSCLDSKSTIMFVLNVTESPELLLTLQTLIKLMRRDISWSVPIILVGSKVSMEISDDELDNVRRNILSLTTIGFRLKAKYDLSAYLECLVDSAEEVEAVMFTAVDVSLLRK